MKKITFIINPISGTKSKVALPGLIAAQLSLHQDISYEILFSEYAGHCGELAAKKVKEGVDIIVAVGGDGTVNEVAKELVHTDVTLGIIPCGSGNGMARHLGISKDHSKAIALLINGLSQLIDYGKINDKDLFFCSCGVGFDAKVSYEFAHAPKRGLFTYFNIAIKENFKYKAETYQIITDSGESITNKAFVIACGNAAQYGNDAFIAPHASMKDGMLDITLIEPFNFMQVPLLSYQLFSRNIDKNHKAKSLRCKKIRIIREKSGVMHFDGEPIVADKELVIETIPLGLRVVTPFDFAI